MAAASPKDEVVEKKPSMVLQALLFLVLTALALGIGFGGGQFIFADHKVPEHAPAAAGMDASHGAAPSDDGHGAAASDDGHGDASDDGHADEGEGGVVHIGTVKLPEIITNLSAPQDIWIRLEAALVTKAPLEQVMLDAIHQDFFTYIRTLQLRELETTSGFLDFKANLLDRANIRTDGKIDRVLINTLLFE